MERVLIRCPATGRAVDSGLEASPAAWPDLALAPRSLACPACGRAHRWTKADARLGGAAPARTDPRPGDVAPLWGDEERRGGA